VPLIDAYDPVYGGFTPPEMVDKGESSQRQVGLYLQDQMKLGADWIVVAGLRHDRAASQPAAASAQTTSATSKRLGLMHVLASGWSPYLSYSESFTPVADIGAQSFEPLRGKQWEAGVKVEPPGTDGLSFSAQVYELKEKNQVVEPTPNVFAQLGQTQVRGVELEAKARLGRSFELSGHYNYIQLDPQLENEPRHQAALWGKYRFALGTIGGFEVGAGVRHMSAYADGAAPRIPDVTLLDAVLAWDTPRWRVALNVNNVTDEIYVANCLSRGDCWWGTRRNAIASVTYRW
jgi:iron complex outermembrane receptor protein